MSITKITRHFEEAVANVITLFRRSSTVLGFLKIWMRQIQDLEEAIFTLSLYWSIDDAAGAHLDRLGSFYEEEREGDSDTEYRLRIKAKKRALTGGTGIADIYAVLTLLGITAAEVEESYGSVYITTSPYVFDSVTRAKQFYRIVKLCKPAGKRMNFEYFLDGQVLLELTTGSDGVGTTGQVGGVLQ